jgi:hypothetical protein
MLNIVFLLCVLLFVGKLNSFSPELKRLGCEAGHSTPPIVEVKIGAAVPPVSPICLHGLQKDNVTFVLEFFSIQSDSFLITLAMERVVLL